MKTHKPNAEWLNQFKSQLAENYSKSSVLAYSKDLTHFMNYLEETSCIELNTEEIQAYLTHNATLLKPDGSRLFKESSLKRQRASLVSFYNYLMDQGVVEENPASAIRFELKEESTTMDYLTKEEAITFLNYIQYFNANEYDFLKARDYFLVRLMLNTGLRILDAKKMETSWFNFETCELTIYDKNNQPRIVPFTADLKADYERYMTLREEVTINKVAYANRVFLTYRGGLISTQIANAMLDRHAKQSRFPKTVNNSILRHTFAYNLIQATNLPTDKKEREAVIKRLAYLLGHESHYFTLKVYDYFFTLKEQQSVTDLIAI